MIGNYQVRETGILGKVLLITDKRELVYYRRGNIYLYNTTKKRKKSVSDCLLKFGRNYAAR